MVLVTLASAWSGVSASGGRRFYDDDPLTRDPETQDASRAEPVDLGLLFELSYNLFVTANYKSANLRAQNVNTIDEVPDSSWFTNRIGALPMSAAALAAGAATGTPPAPGHWTIISEKTSGANVGLTAKDANGETWFLAFDRKENPEGPSAAVVIASRIFWALGYNQVEMFITSFDPKNVTIGPEATRRRPSREKTPFTRDDLDEILTPVARNADGSYRVAAGRLLPGKILGGFRYSGTRPDDPNDLVPHEHRRELRALRVFGAWTNLTDLKAGNTLDTLVTENGQSRIKHYLQDVGSTFGMANRPHEWDIGSEYFYETDPSRRRLFSFGFDLSPWQTTPYKEYPSVGRFEGERFDPTAWKPQTPTTAYMAMRADDAFWAARRVMAFSDELIRAAVHTGQFSDMQAEEYLAKVLAQRRDVIGRTYLTAINPIIDPRLSAAGVLTFENAAVAAGFAAAPTRYRATWSRFDNIAGTSERIGESDGAQTSLTAPYGVTVANGGILEVAVTADSPQYPSWSQPVRVYFRRADSAWKLIGLERLHDGPPPPVAGIGKSR